jgi:hypothetical protein
MRSQAKMIIITVIALLVGIIGGLFLGSELASRVWYRMSKPLVVATGQQAFAVLTMLDRKDEAKLRELMEMEIDSTLLSLRAMHEKNPFDSDDPTMKVFERLQNYRKEHPRAISAIVPKGQ